MRGHGELPFESLVREHTGEDFVERRWLHTAIEEAVRDDSSRLVLVTGEPGSGKTSLLTGLAKARPDWLRYFIRAEDDDGTSATGDIHSFLMWTGHQLAARRPELFDEKRLSIEVTQEVGEVADGASVTGITIDDLYASPFGETATLSVRQSVAGMRGSLSGVKIGRAHLSPRLQDPDNLAHLALIGPARVLLKEDPAARIVILLDALDEATAPPAGRPGLLDWLAGSARLPRNVRVVVTSRPHADLRQLTAPGATTTTLDLDPAHRQVGDDLVRYARNALGTPEILTAAQERGLFPDEFQRQVARRAGGNFLYVASYARALSDAIELGNEDMAVRLFDLDGLPPDLAGIYGVLVDAARQAVEGIGKAALGDQREVYVWESIGQPVLGILTVAREPLPESVLIELSGLTGQRRHVRNVLRHLRWLIVRRADRIALFHTSVGEYLVGEQADREYPECAVEETEWHERIVRHYRGSAASWQEVDWSRVDPYGLVHLVEHLLRSGRPAAAGEAVELVCPGLSRAIRVAFGAERRFLELVDRVARHIARTAPVREGLPRLTYLGVVRHQAAQSSSALPPRALGLLARLGRLKEALEHASGIAPSMHRFAAVAEIWRYAHPGPHDPSAEELLELLVETALTIPRHGTKYYREHEARSAMAMAARLLAPHDLDRAVRLWEYGLAAEQQPSARGELPDGLCRAAAAAEPDPDRACAIIERISADRCADYLDLAERVAPERLAEVLHRAESCLDTARPAAQVVALARLAALWAPHEPDTGRRFLARVRAQVFEAAGEEGLAGRLTRAAEVLADVDRTTARLLLSRLDTMVVDGRTENAVLEAAGLFSRWGSPERAQTLVDRYLAWAKTSWAEHSALSALGRSSRAQELRLLEAEYAEFRDPPEERRKGRLLGVRRDDDLVRIIQRMARLDPARAARIAEDVQRTSWNDSGMWSHYFETAAGDPDRGIYGSDRYSVLAGIAHMHVARGEIDEARVILEDLLRRTEGPALLGGRGGYGSELVVSSPEPPRGAGAGNPPPGVNMDAIMLMFNLSHEWAGRARTHFYRDPADIVRAVELGSHSSLARVVRGLASRLAHRDRDRALALVRSLADPAERAIGFTELHVAAHGLDSGRSHHGPEADAFSQEADRALAQLPHHRWSMSGGDDAEKRAWAYVRPDHRVHFELALRALTCRPQDSQAIEKLPYLAHAAQLSSIAWLSGLYADLKVKGQRPAPVFEELHLALLAPPQRANPEDALTDSARAAAAHHEFRISREVPGHRSRVRQVVIENPVYAAAVDLVTPAPGAPLSSAFTRRVRDMLTEGPLPAAAQLLAFAAEARPEHRLELRELAAQLIARADDGSASGVDALASLAAAPLLGDLVDPVALVDRAERCTFRWPGEHWIPRDVVARLFPVLLERAPDAALRKFYEVASTDWGFAMSLLDHATDALIAALGPEAATELTSAVTHGLTCTSPDGTAPRVVDGVRPADLVTGGAGRDGWTA
ncbi:hypothetical protein ACHBTE_34380 [Streptomyces sp. M41]|uniref:hypothetical protein n=1 Tax=Streptomyces sp. M41 TaxID=3059412 RepID=UPI00374DDCAE